MNNLNANRSVGTTEAVNQQPQATVVNILMQQALTMGNGDPSLRCTCTNNKGSNEEVRSIINTIDRATLNCNQAWERSYLSQTEQW